MTEPLERQAAEPAKAEGETTVEELLRFIARLSGNEPNARCRAGTGALGPVAQALNELAQRMDVRRSSAPETFGMQALVEQVSNIMMTCDAEERIRFVNFSVPGVSPEQVQGQSV